MADDPIVIVPGAGDPPVPAPEPQPVPQPEPVPEPQAQPHPLIPGGVRFEEVIRERNQSRQEAADLRERVARLEGAASATTPKPTEQYYTPQQLQTMVDQGQITPAVMADQIAWQRSQQGKRETIAEVQRYERARGANAEVEQYLAKLPVLNDRSSPEFARVAQAARDISADTGQPISDPVVQRLALRATFGPLDRIVKAGEIRDAARQGADHFAETAGGGGRPAAQPAQNSKLKDVPAALMAHWRSLGYTQAQMEEEAVYITPQRREKLNR